MGWAIDEKGRFPEILTVNLAMDSFDVKLGTPISRPDVEDYLGLSQADFGYSFEFSFAEVKSVEDLLGQGFSVEFLSGEKLQLSGKLLN